MRRLLALSCAIVLVDTIFYGALTPLVPYFSEEFDLSKSEVGVLSGAFGAGVLVGSAPGAEPTSTPAPKAPLRIPTADFERPNSSLKKGTSGVSAP